MLRLMKKDLILFLAYLKIIRIIASQNLKEN